MSQGCRPASSGSSCNSSCSSCPSWFQNETQAHRHHGFHGIDADRRGDLAAHSLHCGTATPWARGFLHRGFSALGLPLKKIRQLYREADAILNVCGTQEFNNDLLVSDRILYVESDPGVEQIKVDKGVKSTMEYLRGHRALFTFGENVGTKSFPVPTHGFKWLPTRQPVVTDLWKTKRSPASAPVFTSVANWSTSGLKDISWRGERYLWSKSREFLRFVSAPAKAGETFELATNIKDSKTRTKFERNGWRLRCPLQMTAGLATGARAIWQQVAR